MIRIFDDSQNSRNIQGLGIFKISQRIQRFQWLRIPSNPFAHTLLLWNWKTGMRIAQLYRPAAGRDRPWSIG